jgi:VanZ family protein
LIAFRDLAWPKRAWIVGPPIAEAIALFILSAQEKLPETPGGDKVAHFTAYAALGFLTARALAWTTAHRGRALVFLSFVLAALYGVSDEFHQSFVPGRDASVADALADAAGALIGSLGWLRLSAVRVFSSSALPPRSPPREGSPPEDRAP